MEPTNLFTVLILGLILSACSTVTSVDLKEAQIHFQAARHFENLGDFASAREQYSKALVSARTAEAGPETISMLTYEFGRTTGYACHFEESETSLVESLKIEEGLPQRNSRNIGIRRFELARLMYDQKRYKDAADYYSAALSEVEKYDGIKSDPIAFSGSYEEYADSLEKIGEIKNSKEALGKAKSLIEDNLGKEAIFKPVRYKCNSPIATQPIEKY